MMTWNQFGCQDAISPTMEELIYFHDFLMTVLTFIIFVVGTFMLNMFFNFWLNLNLAEAQGLELVWTLVPAFILIQLALPSLLLLYLIDDDVEHALTLKSIGHQWYWSYEYSDFWSNKQALQFDSTMDKFTEEEISNSHFPLNTFRTLDVDNRVILPYKTPIRNLVSSADVIHSWTIPSLGVKADAMPGRLNQIVFLSYLPGVYFGQCSEICGTFHSFMPICLEFISIPDFLSWVKTSMAD